MKYSFAFLPVLLLFACNSKKPSATPGEPPAGGPCTYKYDTLPARVIEIDRQANQPTRVMFAVLRQSGTDTTSYFMVNKRDVPEEELKQKSVTEGAVFQYIDGRMVSGACNPHVYHIALDKYEGRLPAERDTPRGYE